MEIFAVLYKIIMVTLVFSVLIIVHEWGHFITARRLGIRVERFSIGFGKKIFSRKSGDTEYMVSAVPLGGYVKMAGDERSHCQGKPDEFYSHPIGHRSFVVLMGPVVNFLFAYLCFYLLCVSGFPRWAPKVGEVSPGSPAQQAGLQKDDYIFAISGQDVQTWTDMQRIIRGSNQRELFFHVRRRGNIISKAIVPRLDELKNEFGQAESVPIIGIRPSGDFVLIRQGLLKSFGAAWRELIKIPILTFKTLYHIFVGDVPARGNIGGPVLIVVAIWESIRLGMAHVVYITAVISASLAVINLFPLPVLDGGHIFLMGLERMRGRPLSPRVDEWLTKAGMALLLLLVIFVFYNDITQFEIINNIKNFIQDLF